MTSVDINPTLIEKKQRLSISQMMINHKETLTGEEHELVLPKKLSRQDLGEKLRRRR